MYLIFLVYSLCMNYYVFGTISPIFTFDLTMKGIFVFFLFVKRWKCHNVISIPYLPDIVTNTTRLLIGIRFSVICCPFSNHNKYQIFHTIGLHNEEQNSVTNVSIDAQEAREYRYPQHWLGLQGNQIVVFGVATKLLFFSTHSLWDDASPIAKLSWYFRMIVSC